MLDVGRGVVGNRHRGGRISGSGKPPRCPAPRGWDAGVCETGLPAQSATTWRLWERTPPGVARRATFWGGLGGSVAVHTPLLKCGPQGLTALPDPLEKLGALFHLQSARPGKAYAHHVTDAGRAFGGTPHHDNAVR